MRGIRGNSLLRIARKTVASGKLNFNSCATDAVSRKVLYKRVHYWTHTQIFFEPSFTSTCHAKQAPQFTMDSGARLEPTYAAVNLLDAAGNDDIFSNSTSKRSFAWRALHSMLCIVGGIAFLMGSIQYFPSKSRETFGAVLFTVGSLGFFLADLMDWITHHAVTCCSRPTSKYKKANKVGGPHGLCCSPSYQLESALNAGLTTTGSLCYFIGCILFIPALRSTLIGDILFVPGSLIIFVSMAWKLYRTGCTPHCDLNEMLNDSKAGFRWKNLWHSDPATLMADGSLLLGAAAFLAGSILFLPLFNKTDRDTTVATIVFVVGSVLFIFSGCGLFYGYFVADYTGV